MNHNRRSLSVVRQYEERTRALAKTIGLSVNLAKLPQHAERATRSAVSDEAANWRHNAVLIKLGKQGRRPKNFASMQERAAQRLIEEFGDFETREAGGQLCPP